MTITAPPRTTARKLARFVGHYVEMVAAMLVGMVVLAPLWPAAWTDHPQVGTVVGAVAMATDMTVAMAAWMAVRRHSWPRIVEMSAVMYLPFLVLLLPWWLGVLSPMAVMVAGHVVMFPLMLVAMVWRSAEYWH